MTGRILLVEDNAQDIALTKRVLEKNHLADEVIVARDGAEALDYIFGKGAYEGRDVANLPEVVLLDLKMPKVDGLEVLRRIREDSGTNCLPVVILTSSDEERDMAEGYRLGANSYVLKPVDFTLFTESLRQLGLYWLFLNKLPYRRS